MSKYKVVPVSGNTEVIGAVRGEDRFFEIVGGGNVTIVDGAAMVAVSEPNLRFCVPAGAAVYADANCVVVRVPAPQEEY